MDYIWRLRDCSKNAQVKHLLLLPKQMQLSTQPGNEIQSSNHAFNAFPTLQLHLYSLISNLHCRRRVLFHYLYNLDSRHSISYGFKETKKKKKILHYFYL